MTGYRGGKDSLYDVLGVYRSSTAQDIERAYKRLKAEAEKDAAPPDEVALLRQAHEVLSDPNKRAQYDKSLASDGFMRSERTQADTGVKWNLVGGIAAVVVVLILAVWFLLRSSGPGDRIPAEIAAAAAPAVGRLNIIDIQGRASAHDNAFSIDRGVMLTTCRGFKANTQAVVKFGQQRTAPANVTRSDPKRNLCRLAVVGAGSFPLVINTTPPESGDRAYAVSTNATGDTVLQPVKVRGILSADGGGRAIEISEPVNPMWDGGPLLDTKGRVIGVLATQHAFPGKNVALPASWVAEIRAAPIK